jgi:signal transduction histidine kinase
MLITIHSQGEMPTKTSKKQAFDKWRCAEYGSLTALVQVMNNVIHNAIKFTPTGSLLNNGQTRRTKVC